MSKHKVIIVGQDPYPNKSIRTEYAFEYREDLMPSSFRNLMIATGNPLSLIQDGSLALWRSNGILTANTYDEIGERDYSNYLNMLNKEHNPAETIWILLGAQAQHYASKYITTDSIQYKLAHPSGRTASKFFQNAREIFSEISIKYGIDFNVIPRTVK